MLGTCSSNGANLGHLRIVIGLACGEPGVVMGPTWGILESSKDCMLGTYSSNGGNLGHLRLVIGLRWEHTVVMGPTWGILRSS